MKRRIFAMALAAAAMTMTLADCSSPPDGGTDATGAPDGWVAPPRIEAAQRTPAGLTVRGHAAPLGRVVLRGDANTAYATVADDGGRFELKIQAPTADALFIVEAQNGQVAAPAPYRLFVARNPAGPIGLLTPGAPSRRLDGDTANGARLDAVDSDGRALLMSGRAAPRSVLALAISGRASVQVQAGPDGLWIAQPGAGSAGPTSVTVDRATYAYPGSATTAPATGDFSVEATSAGWRVRWIMPAGGVQTTWFPATRL